MSLSLIPIYSHVVNSQKRSRFFQATAPAEVLCETRDSLYHTISWLEVPFLFSTRRQALVAFDESYWQQIAEF
jgi:hypothetical protein